MVIKIEDIPEGRLVKQITFDILFEDGNTVDVEKIIKTDNSINNTKVSEIPVPMPSTLNDEIPGFDPSIRPNIVTEKREQKEIPNEMLNQEF